MRLVGRFLEDQEKIWTSPAKMHLADADWILPVAGVSATLFATDASFSKSISNSASTIQHYKTISTAGVGALAGAAGGMWLLSYRSHNEHWRETGFLAGESALNSLVMVETLKYSLRRERPLQGDGSGPFFQSGGTSFPSEHSAAAWSIAGVIAHEYPGPLTKFTAYGLATLVSFSRVRAKQHFPSDVFIGGLAGYMISQNIYDRHADPELGGAVWKSFSAMFRGNQDLSPQSMGSTYVPLDSWVYPAFERLEALGYIHTAFEGVKPWTRTECARLLSEAAEEMSQPPAKNSSAAEEEAQSLLAVLSKEFHRETELQTGDLNRSAALESAYTRVTSASGPVLTDGFHFGQTFAYDDGRPFRRGTNLISGFSSDFTSGRVFLHLSGEFQHAAGAPALSDAERQVIAERDQVPLSPAQPFAAINQLALMDSYIGVNLNNWQVSFGKQSLSWGPGPGGSLILSNNADSFYMVRITQVQPMELPSVLGWLGPVRLETFAGSEKDHPYSGHPFVYGQKISLKPFRSLEFAYARTTTVAGNDDPLNTRTFIEGFFGRVDPNTGSVPGDSHTSVDWTWKVPGLHDRLVFYGELEDDDDPIPLQNLTKAVLRPGIYVARLPWLNKWDFHGEWTSSETPGRGPNAAHGDFNYWNQSYRDGYTNDGNLVTNTVGREGKTLQVWTRCWISPRHTLEFTAKNSEVYSDFIPGGGRWQDYRATDEVALRSGLYFRSFVQFERIGHFPLLFSGARNNVTASLEIGFAPGLAH
ncbi:MAG TPA: capsule assembly Wzi family protein [Verrucomicrobiae bacterium]|nr:capsule assembly Wzi family protein [Verrucomicrobiae bacterium]